MDVPVKGNTFGGRQPCITYDNSNYGYNVYEYPKFMFERSLPSHTYGEAPVDAPVKDLIRRMAALKDV